MLCFVKVHFPRACFTSGTKMFGWQFTELCWAGQKRKQRGGSSQCCESALLLHGLIESFQTSWHYQLSPGHAVVWRETPFPSFLSRSFQFWILAGGGRASSCTAQPSSSPRHGFSFLLIFCPWEPAPDLPWERLDLGAVAGTAASLGSRWCVNYSCPHKAMLPRLFALTDALQNKLLL